MNKVINNPKIVQQACLFPLEMKVVFTNVNTLYILEGENEQ